MMRRNELSSQWTAPDGDKDAKGSIIRHGISRRIKIANQSSSERNGWLTMHDNVKVPSFLEASCCVDIESI
jgi:hypothetical protein